MVRRGSESEQQRACRREVVVIDAGQRIAGQYRLIDHVATGGMGVVWLARDERLQRPVAIKQLVLQPGLSAAETDDLRRRALREAQIAARLQHPNAVTVFDITEHDGAPCLVMEYLPSRSLAAIVAERGPLGPREVAGIGWQAAAALAAAHAVQILHRDVKPANILITDFGVAKITDFGIARAPGDATVTQTGLVAGTPAYLAPEVARGQQATPASDVFSLGATLYAAVEGHGPFGDQDNQLALLHTVAAGNVQPPQQAGPLTPVLQWLLSPRPEQRPDMEQARAELTKLLGASTGVPAPGRPAPTIALGPAAPAPPPAGRPRIPRRAGVLVAAVAAVLALGGLGIAALLDQPDGDQRPQASAQRPDITQAPAPRITPSRTDPATPSSPSPEPSPEPTPTSPSPETTPSPTPETEPVSGEPIEWSAAGQLVIDYYAGAPDQSGAWEMLTPSAQADFGSRSAFREYWNQYAEVWAQNAYGVTVNDNGSVNVPVDVIYVTEDGEQREQQVLRVTRRDGQLLIDSAAR
jgi:serine/threonine protein kinase